MQNTDVLTRLEMSKDLAFHSRCTFSENHQGLICMHSKDHMIKSIYRPVGELQTDFCIPLAYATPDWGSEMDFMILGYCSQEGVDIRLGAMFNGAPEKAPSDSL